VAIGTIGLAAVTFGLALTTRRLAKATADEVRAQWRPVLVPGTNGTPFTPLATRPLVYDRANRWLYVSVRNAGRGPALHVRVLLTPENQSPDHWSLGSISPGDEVQLRFSAMHRFDVGKQLLLDYRDLGGRAYSSVLVLDAPSEQHEPRYYDVRVFEDQTVTPHGDVEPPAMTWSAQAPSR
jgi:hypothetical protein